MKTQNFTTTLAIPIINWLSKTAKSEGKSRRGIIEEALILWSKKQNQKKLRQSALRMKNDQELKEFSNLGITEWEKMTQKIERN